MNNIPRLRTLPAPEFSWTARWRSLCAIGLAAVCLGPVFSTLAAEEGCQSIFDGQTLSGWNKAAGDTINKNYLGGEWKVEDGAIVGRQLPPLVGSFLRTDAKYQDFDLLIDVNPDWGCDSGIWIRTDDEGRCLQIFLDYLPGGNVGFLYGQGTGGFASQPWQLEAVEEGGKVVGVKAVDQYDGVKVDGLLYSAKAEDFNKVWRHGEFNTLRIRCEGPQPLITTWINGVKMMELDGTTFRGKKVQDLRAGKFDAPQVWDQKKIQESNGGPGTIALQVHPGNRWNGFVRYKDIKIKTLP